MDDYQRHIESQLQQQQQQLLRNQQQQATSDLNNPARPLQQSFPLIQPQQQGQQHQRITPGQQLQWPAGFIPGVPGAHALNPSVGAPGGFGRGIPMSIAMQQQQQQQQQQQSPQQQSPPPRVPQQIVQNTTFQSASPQPPVQNAPTPQAPLPIQKTQISPPPPDSPVAPDAQAEKMRIATILEINSRLIKICLSLQATVSPEGITTDPTYSGCLSRLQQNLAYLAAIADRANKPEGAQRQLPILTLMVSPPMIRVPEEKEALDKLYKTLSSLQSNTDPANGDNGSGSEPSSQVNSPQVRNRQESSATMGTAGTPTQHGLTPTLQRSQLPGQQHTPSPRMIPNQIHGQSGLNPNPPPQTNIRPQQSQQSFQQTFPQNQQFPQQAQFQQFGQQQFPSQPNQQFQSANIVPMPLMQQNQSFQQQTQSPPFPQAQPQSFAQNQASQFQQGQTQQFTSAPQSFQNQPHLQAHVPSRPPSRPSSQHSLGHQASPTISPRPGDQPSGRSPQLTSTPTPPNPSPRVGVPNLPVDLTPEQTAVLQERMRQAREARLAQLQQAQQGRITGLPLNLSNLPNGIGIPNQNQNGVYSTFPQGPGSMMNGMNTNWQNFGGNSDGNQ